ncbi:MAG: BamA/TamA family outer membrane protein, partial [Candidatus Eisenbacteria bacterium]|nr:BamA/TamA family outer membrane protein [Candidatus Eisenbacteria bacterium]
LPTERFFAGGVNSMRGFKRRKLGPLDASGAPIGGEALLEGSVELRFPIWGKLVGALFTDTGQVWEKRTQVRLSDLEVAVGGGLGFRTPIGPVRADVGHRLTDIIPGQPMTVFHLAIGNPY